MTFAPSPRRNPLLSVMAQVTVSIARCSDPKVQNGAVRGRAAALVRVSQWLAPHAPNPHHLETLPLRYTVTSGPRVGAGAPRPGLHGPR